MNEDRQELTLQEQKHTVAVDSMDEVIRLFGVFDENLKVIEEETGAVIKAGADCIDITGPEEAAALAETVLDKLLAMLRKGENIDRSRIRYAIDLAKEGNADLILELIDDVVAFTNKGRKIKCRTLGQKKYISALKRNTVVFGVGPAGTGKTYLAVAMAVLAYKNKEVEKIILTRPAVEAGEKLGFLPGEMKDKLDPYLQPLYDALQDMIPGAKLKEYMENNVIQIAPLAFMRGRTLNDAVVILDEAQNTTAQQIKMFLTRMGMNTKMIVTGDMTQIDLPASQTSGLVQALRILKGVKGISFVELNKKDIVRHKLVERIVDAYEKFDKEAKAEREKREVKKQLIN